MTERLGRHHHLRPRTLALTMLSPVGQRILADTAFGR